MKSKRIVSSPLLLFVGLLIEIIGVALLWFLILSPTFSPFPFPNNLLLRILHIIFVYLFGIRMIYASLISLLMLVNIEASVIEFNFSKRRIYKKGSIIPYCIREIGFDNVREVVEYFEPSMKTHYLVIVDDLGGDIRSEKNNSYIRISNTLENKRFLESIGFVISKKQGNIF